MFYVFNMVSVCVSLSKQSLLRHKRGNKVTLKRKQERRKILIRNKLFMLFLKGAQRCTVLMQESLNASKGMFVINLDIGPSSFFNSPSFWYYGPVLQSLCDQRLKQDPIFISLLVSLVNNQTSFSRNHGMGPLFCIKIKGKCCFSPFFVSHNDKNPFLSNKDKLRSKKCKKQTITDLIKYIKVLFHDAASNFMHI